MWIGSSIIYFFKQKTAYEMRISDWSSDVCSSDLPGSRANHITAAAMTSAGMPSHARCFRDNMDRSAMIGTLGWASDCTEPRVSQPRCCWCVRCDGHLVCTRIVWAPGAGLPGCVVHAEDVRATGQARWERGRGGKGGE